MPDARRRVQRETFIAEGRLIVAQLLRAPRFRVRSVLATPAAVASLGRALDGGDAPVYVAPPAMLARIVGFHFHRGCLAAGERPPDFGIEPLVAPGGRRLLVGLDGVTNPDNVGGVFRNARAFGADGVLLGPGCADPLYRRALRVSMGAALETPFASVADWTVGIARLRAAGFRVAALTPDRDALDVAACAPPPRLVLLLGAESDGLADTTRAACDIQLRIAMAAGIDSLNVATAAGIALHRLHACGSG